MEIKLERSTGDIETKEEDLEFGRAAARVCYSKHDFSTLVEEEDKIDLVGTTLKSGHHSPYGHVNLTFYFNDLPKFGAMILNNERPYVTSEKSARYTVMPLEGEQKEVYGKWRKIFQERIKQVYPFLDDVNAKKLAQENARYMTSVFTPTKMLHTISFRQLNSIMHFFNDYLKEAPDNEFNKRVKAFMGEFNDSLEHFYEGRLDPAVKQRRLSIFAERECFAEEFGENYSTTYPASFAQLAQAHRHRTLDYEIVDFQGKSEEFFVPPILKSDPKLVVEWLKDIQSFADDFPQGTLIKVHEKGNYGDFISKMNERLCGHAQQEIMSRTRDTLKKYLENTEETNSDVYQALLPWSKGPRCTVPKVKCNGSPCPFGPELGLERLV